MSRVNIKIEAQTELIKMGFKTEEKSQIYWYKDDKCELDIISK